MVLLQVIFLCYHTHLHVFHSLCKFFMIDYMKVKVVLIITVSISIILVMTFLLYSML